MIHPAISYELQIEEGVNLSLGETERQPEIIEEGSQLNNFVSSEGLQFLCWLEHMKKRTKDYSVLHTYVPQNLTLLAGSTNLDTKISACSSRVIFCKFNESISGKTPDISLVDVVAPVCINPPEVLLARLYVWQGKNVFIILESVLVRAVIFSRGIYIVKVIPEIKVVLLGEISRLADDVAPLGRDGRPVPGDGEGGLVQLPPRNPVCQTGLSVGVRSYDLAAVRSEEGSPGSGPEIIVVRVHHLLFDIEGLVVVLNHASAIYGWLYDK